MRKPNWQNVLLFAVLVSSVALLGFLSMQGRHLSNEAEAAARPLKLEDIPFDGDQAYTYLKEMCALGVRYSGSPGMQRQQEMLTAHFRKLGGRVTRQEFQARDPRNGQAVAMANLVIEFHPERKERILFCAHYDTRPFPDRDPQRPKGVFLGANDGASGVAILMELGKRMPELPGELGVDFALFDGEELVYAEGDPYFLGSTYFAEQYALKPPGHRYRWGVLLDMVGDANLRILQERNSISWADTRPLVTDIFRVARKLGVKEFVAKPGFTLNDDHIALHNIGKIPTCDLIDFEYPQWHTEADTPQHCSALSLAKVGWVVEEWLRQESGRAATNRR